MFKKAMFALTWTMLIVVGCGLFLLSFVIESKVLTSLLKSSPLTGVASALLLETSKGLAVIWNRYFALHGESFHRPATATVVRGYRLLLLLLSVICSLLFFGVNLDRPNLETVRANDLAALDQSAKQAREEIRATAAARMKRLSDAQQRELETLTRHLHERVERLARQLSDEMDNVVKGEFVGKRYRAIEKRLENAKRAESVELRALAKRQREEREKLDARVSAWRSSRLEAIEQDYARRAREMRQGDYGGDNRVYHPMIVAFAQMCKALLGWSPQPLQFVFVFSVLISVAMELGIVHSLETATSAVFPILAAQHQSEVDKNIAAARIDAESAAQKMRHRATLSTAGDYLRRATEALKQTFDSSHHNPSGGEHE